MKERPIIFNAPMVRAILDGTKTQARFALDPKPALERAFIGGVMRSAWVYKGTADPDGWVMYEMCPYGKPGDRLLVNGGNGLLLDIVSVRVERLQDISAQDCTAEGSCSAIGTPRAYGHVTEQFALEQFRRLWIGNYGADSWIANPWVWVIEFKRVG